MVAVSIFVAVCAECHTLSLVRTIFAEVSVTATHAFALIYGLVEAAQSASVLVIETISQTISPFGSRPQLSQTIQPGVGS